MPNKCLEPCVIATNKQHTTVSMAKTPQLFQRYVQLDTPKAFIRPWKDQEETMVSARGNIGIAWMAVRACMDCTAHTQMVQSTTIRLRVLFQPSTLFSGTGNVDQPSCVPNISLTDSNFDFKFRIFFRFYGIPGLLGFFKFPKKRLLRAYRRWKANRNLKQILDFATSWQY